jgi:CheY-like chemotaxis protein
MNILLVEDNEGDARLLRELLQETNKSVCLHVVANGIEAMEFLRYQGPYSEAPRPDLVLLDLSMPKMDGLEVLAQVKANPWLKTIPLIVLTTSQAEMDIDQSYKLMASCYLVKPAELKVFEALIKSLNEFWLTKVTYQKHGQTAGRL